MRDPNAREYLVYDSNTLIAYVAIVFGSTGHGRYWVGDKEGIASIDIFILKQKFLKRGYGTRIITEVSGHLLSLSYIYRVSLDPSPGNRIAIRFYEKAGFVQIGLFRNMEGEPSRMMIKERTQP